MSASGTPLPDLARFSLTDTHRLVAAVHPVRGILDVLVRPEDLEAILELEGWTDDRISNELGILLRIPRSEWVTGVPHAHVIMSAYTHPAPNGSRFNDATRGAWYAAADIDTAHAESMHRRRAMLAEIGAFDTMMHVRGWLSDFDGRFHDLTPTRSEFNPCYDPNSHAASQRLARELIGAGSSALVYRSVRRPSGRCIVSFQPKVINHVRPSGLFEYTWSGPADPEIRQISR